MPAYLLKNYPFLTDWQNVVEEEAKN